MNQVHPLAPSSLRKLTIAIALALPAITTSIQTMAEDTGAANAANPQAAAISFNIPAQVLTDALNAFISASDWQVGFPADLAKNVRSTPIQGSYSPQQALDRLLQGTGLTYRLTGNNNVRLEKSEVPVASPEPQSAITLPKVNVVGNNVYDVTDPYNKDYVLPNATSGTKTDTPIMETPLNVQVISKQVLKDQQVINLGDALKNVSGVTTGSFAY